MATPTNLTHLLSTLITANHILHYNSILDAYGHLSVRNPHNSSTFFLSSTIAPALLSSAEEIIGYRVDDAEPVEPNAPAGFTERFIHSEVYKRYPAINSVLHSHLEEIVPFGVVDTSLLPVAQTGSVFGMLSSSSSSSSSIPFHICSRQGRGER